MSRKRAKAPKGQGRLNPRGITNCAQTIKLRAQGAAFICREKVADGAFEGEGVDPTVHMLISRHEVPVILFHEDKGRGE